MPAVRAARYAGKIVGEERSPAEIVAASLATCLGPNTARTAVRTFADRALARRPEDLTRADVPALLDALRPMLRTLIGQDPADLVLAEIRAQLAEPPARARRA